MNCPKCGEVAWRDSADVGVGVIHGPYGCPCGWSEDEYWDKTDGPSTAETERPGFHCDPWGGVTRLDK